jgi:nitroreductase
VLVETLSITHQQKQSVYSLHKALVKMTQLLLQEAISMRHSTRLFLPRPVPDGDLREALQLAMRSPSEYNAQIWRVYVATGPALERLKAALTAAASKGPSPAEAQLPPLLRACRSATGKMIYGEGWGIPREDKAARHDAAMRNFEFFGAPVGVIVCMPKVLPGVEALSIGMYLQTLVLALQDRGIGSCVQIAIAEYPEEVRAALRIPEELDILVGMAIGYEDTSARVNKLRSGRLPYQETTIFMQD